MQTASDSLLGWYRLRALDDKVHDFYVRQLWDGKASIDVTHLTAGGLASYTKVCGISSRPHAHARSGFRVSIAAYLGDTDEFDDAVVDSRRPTPMSTTRTMPHCSRRSNPAGLLPRSSRRLG